MLCLSVILIHGFAAHLSAQNDAMLLLNEMEPSAHSVQYIINASSDHPFIFDQALAVVKDDAVQDGEKSVVVYQTLIYHHQLYGYDERYSLDVQKLILYLMGDYQEIESKLRSMPEDHLRYYLSTLHSYQAIDFKYMAQLYMALEKEDMSDVEQYIVNQADSYKKKYTEKIASGTVSLDGAYGKHCQNIIHSCDEALRVVRERK